MHYLKAQAPRKDVPVFMTNRPESGEIEIFLPHFIKLLKRKGWIIVLCMILCGALALSYAVFIAGPKYESRALLYVNNSEYSYGISDSPTIGADELSAARSLADSYVLILTSRTTMEEVIEKAALDCTYEELSKMVRAGAVDNTEFFEIVCTSDDPAEAELIVDTFTEILPAKIAEIVEGSSFRIVDEGDLPAEKSSPSNVKTAFLGLIIGFAAGCAVLIVLELVNNTVRDADYLAERYVLPVFSVGYDLSSHTPSDASDEEIRQLRAELLYSFAGEKNCVIIGVTSSMRGEGTTGTALNLAVSLAEAGKRTLLLDADMRAPEIHEKLKLNRAPGLSELLSGHGGAGVVRHSAHNDKLSVITAGNSTADPAEMILSERMKRVLSLLAEKYEYIVIDLPPVGIAADAVVMAETVNGMIVAVREDQTDRKALDTALDRLKRHGANIVGFVIAAQTKHNKKHRHNAL